VALGAPDYGLDGFRATHQQATRAQRLLLTAPAATVPDLVCFTEPGVPTATLLAENIDHTRNLVRAVLGPLAQDDPAAARLRETLLEYLITGCSYTLAGARLSMHKNTVKYRVARAETERGKPLSDDRSDVEIALLACRWFGATVLAPAQTSMRS
jgi:DNA-binding PucR family transcriptional regulator